MRWLAFIGVALNLWAFSSAEEGALQVTVFDENGHMAQGTHVYIFSRDKKEFIGMRDAYGTASFELPAGKYRVYAARTTHTNGYIEHYASREARVRLRADDDPPSIILTLRKAEHFEIYLTETARKKLGIDEKLAKFLN